MTYARFLLLFLVLPLGLLALRQKTRQGPWRPLLALLPLVYLATAPWDSWAVAHGLWTFAEEKTWGVRLGPLPVEEYLFFGLQTLLTGVLVRARLGRLPEFAAGATP
jgi:lycopene cyclase domain-containing protein